MARPSRVQLSQNYVLASGGAMDASPVASMSAIAGTKNNCAVMIVVSELETALFPGGGPIGRPLVQATSENYILISDDEI